MDPLKTREGGALIIALGVGTRQVADSCLAAIPAVCRKSGEAAVMIFSVFAEIDRMGHALIA
jgi:hypothetical protein